MVLASLYKKNNKYNEAFAFLEKNINNLGRTVENEESRIFLQKILLSFGKKFIFEEQFKQGLQILFPNIYLKQKDKIKEPDIKKNINKPKVINEIKVVKETQTKRNEDEKKNVNINKKENENINQLNKEQKIIIELREELNNEKMLNKKLNGEIKDLKKELDIIKSKNFNLNEKINILQTELNDEKIKYKDLQEKLRIKEIKKQELAKSSKENLYEKIFEKDNKIEELKRKIG